MGKITDKVIVITGGTSGIGKKLVERLSGQNTVVTLARSCPHTANTIPCDVSSAEAVEAAFDEIKAKFGRVDILINNAGYGISGAVELMPDEEVERIFDVNFMGVFRCAKHALPLMGAGGKIVNISSACAIFPLPFRGFYCASKAAVSMFSHSLRGEVAPYGIDVTAICPGDIKTEFTVNRRRNYATNERYGDRIVKADEHISSREDKRMSPDRAADRIVKIVGKRKYKPMYIVGGKYKLLYALYRLFPQRVIYGATNKMFAPANKKK